MRARLGSPVSESWVARWASSSSWALRSDTSTKETSAPPPGPGTGAPAAAVQVSSRPGTSTVCRRATPGERVADRRRPRRRCLACRGRAGRGRRARRRRRRGRCPGPSPNGPSFSYRAFTARTRPSTPMTTVRPPRASSSDSANAWRSASSRWARMAPDTSRLTATAPGEAGVVVLAAESPTLRPRRRGRRESPGERRRASASPCGSSPQAASSCSVSCETVVSRSPSGGRARLRAGDAVEPLGAAVPLGHDAVLVDGDHGVGDAVEDVGLSRDARVAGPRARARSAETAATRASSATSSSVNRWSSPVRSAPATPRCPLAPEEPARATRCWTSKRSTCSRNRGSRKRDLDVAHPVEEVIELQGVVAGAHPARLESRRTASVGQSVARDLV